MPLTLTLRIHIEAKSFTHREDIQKSVEASFQPKTPKYQVLLRNFPTNIRLHFRKQPLTAKLLLRHSSRASNSRSKLNIPFLLDADIRSALTKRCLII